MGDVCKHCGHGIQLVFTGESRYVWMHSLGYQLCDDGSGNVAAPPEEG